MSAQMAKEARRDLRRAIGEEALGLLESNAEELRRLDHEHKRMIGRTMMILGRDNDKDIKNPVLQRLDLMESNLSRTINALDVLVARVVGRDQSFWTRMRWLLTGR